MPKSFRLIVASSKRSFSVNDTVPDASPKICGLITTHLSSARVNMKLGAAKETKPSNSVTSLKPSEVKVPSDSSITLLAIELV